MLNDLHLETLSGPFAAMMSQIMEYPPRLLAGGFLPAVLGVLQLNGMLAPVRNMMNSVLDMLPRIFAAAMIALAGWFIAKILRALVSNLLSAAGLDRVSASVGMKNELHLSNLAGVLVFILMFIPVPISALDTLDITAISA